MLLFNTDRIQRKSQAGTDASDTSPHYRTQAKQSIRPFLSVTIITTYDDVAYQVAL